MTPTAWRLVRFLWNRTNRTADFDSLAEPVWEDHATEVDAILVGTHRKYANNFFEEHKLPFEIRTKNRCVQLVPKLPPQTPENTRS